MLSMAWFLDIHVKYYMWTIPSDVLWWGYDRQEYIINNKISVANYVSRE